TKQMAEVENMAEKSGVSKKMLMKNAGRKLAERIIEISSKEEFSAPENTNVVFLAGSGNNGGDCFAAAYILIYRGYNVTVVNLINSPSTEIARECFDALPEKVKIVTGWRSKDISAAVEVAKLDYTTIWNADISALTQKKELIAVEKLLLSEKKRMTDIREAVVSADILVDGVFGTGIHGQLDKDIMSVFAIGTGAYRVSVDIPSGGDGSKGTVSAGIFKADETVCLGCLKFGMTQYPLKKFCGKITVADIGIPKNAYNVIEGKREYYRIERNSLAGFPPKRERDAHKGTFGTVLVVAGSSSMRGAAVFAVLGALKSGAGVVRLASVGKCIDSVSVLAPEATFIELESDNNGFMRYGGKTEEILYDAVKKADSVVIGSGMGVTDDTMEIVRFVVQNAETPVIIDADGINCIARDIEILMDKKSEVIITPHPGEMARLLKCDSGMINDNRIMAAEKYAEQYGITVVLKGAGTIISDRHRTSANHTGNAGMSKGGSGDILSGIIGSAVA
ncbi:MAG: NAD(P)H-hydrate dehydratase, partial [Ruminococcus sp.]|nr:NAD(P)H-hydrate dehydratase [Ruminococcus sp.]